MDHIEGITVLNEYISEVTHWTIIIPVLCIALSLVYGIVAWANESIKNAIISILSFILFGIIFILLWYDVFKIYPDEIIYEVIFDDNVTYRDIIETYEVIDHRGNIYEVKFLNNI